MEIRLISSTAGHPNSSVKLSTNKSAQTYVQDKNNCNKINTTIKSNSDGRASFKGGSTVPFLHKAANFTAKNPLVAEALFAIIITCGLRPMCIMATAKNEEEKEKCSYQAAKSIASGLVGLAMTALIGGTIAAASGKAAKNGALKIPESIKQKSQEYVNKGIDALTNLGKQLTADNKNPELVKQITELTDGGKIHLISFKHLGSKAEKIFKKKIKDTSPEIYTTVKKALKEQHTLDNYEKAGKNVIDKFFQPIFMPLRANVTVALIPTILGVFGLKKSASKSGSKQKEAVSFQNYSIFHSQKAKNLFNAFEEVNYNENK